MSQSEPNLTVVIPVHNAAPHLGACVESLLAQSYTDFELILVENGSSDDSRERCARYAAEHPGRIRTLTLDEASVSAARNAGIDNARGRFITFMDADDWAERGVFQLRRRGARHRRRSFGSRGTAVSAGRMQRLQTLPHGDAPPPRNPLHRTPLLPRRPPFLLHLHQPDAVGRLAQRPLHALHAPRTEHAQHTPHAGLRTRRGRRAARPLHPAVGRTLRHHGQDIPLRPAAESGPRHAATGRKQHPFRRPPERPRSHCRPPGAVRRRDLHAPLASAAETPAARPHSEGKGVSHAPLSPNRAAQVVAAPARTF
uniref:glycosyltransferase family 2 protein n=1 Tax=Alistipes shahii TaxID=328814 RepID=UPI003FEF16FA